MIRIVESAPVPDREALLRVLDASGLGRLETLAAVSGMTDEGTASSMWLGFDGAPQGLFAAPTTGIGADQLARIPADAMMAQAWSLDLSKSLAAGLDMLAAMEPQAAAEVRRSLEEFRAVVGVDLDGHLLQPLGPDWTVLSVPPRAA